MKREIETLRDRLNDASLFLAHLKTLTGANSEFALVERIKALQSVVKATKEYFTAAEICRLQPEDASEDDYANAIFAASELHDALRGLEAL